MPLCYRKFRYLGGNGDFEFDTGINVDNDLLHDFSRGSEVNEPLVDPHLVAIPSLRTFTTGSLSGGDLEMLGREPDWTAHPKFVRLGTVNEFCADLLENLDLARRQRDADFVSLDFLDISLFLVERHI